LFTHLPSLDQGQKVHSVEGALTSVNLDADGAHEVALVVAGRGEDTLGRAVVFAGNASAVLESSSDGQDWQFVAREEISFAAVGPGPAYAPSWHEVRFAGVEVQPDLYYRAHVSVTVLKTGKTFADIVASERGDALPSQAPWYE
ncbi:MAG: hypothetical protein LC620_08390, partial [Halobacteriales archaeon]|nr:hypothetical protein [Halobacteriales archaeon]